MYGAVRYDTEPIFFIVKAYFTQNTTVSLHENLSYRTLCYKKRKGSIPFPAHFFLCILQTSSHYVAMVSRFMKTIFLGLPLISFFSLNRKEFIDRIYTMFRFFMCNRGRLRPIKMRCLNLFFSIGVKESIFMILLFRYEDFLNRTKSN